MSTPKNLSLFYKAGNLLGEGAAFDPATQIFYWVDIPDSTVHSMTSKGVYTCLKMPVEAGFVVPCSDNRLIVGGDQKLLVLENGVISHEIKCEHANNDVVINDGSIHPNGRFLLFGTRHVEERRPVGEMFVARDKVVSKEELRFSVFNGPAFSPGGEKVYFTDSPTGIINVADIDPETGGIVSMEVFHDVPSDRGFPDGMAMDAAGCLWSAHWDGSCLTRYRPDGSIQKIYDLPVKRPTSLAFTGKDLKTVIVTSAGMDRPDPETIPGTIQDGDLLTFEVEVPGIALPYYSGALLDKPRI